MVGGGYNREVREQTNLLEFLEEVGRKKNNEHSSMGVKGRGGQSHLPLVGDIGPPLSWIKPYKQKVEYEWLVGWGDVLYSS
jgi:hypothetical protein